MTTVALRTLRVAFLFGPWLICGQAFGAMGFEPTTDEWTTWPPYCRARYASLAFQIQDTELVNQISQSEIDYWTASLGPTFVHVHHYCFALSNYRRSLTESSEQNRKFRLNDAMGDAKYTVDRIKPSDPLAPEITALYAQIENELGRPEHAKALLNATIDAQPKADRPYLVLSSMERKSGNLTDAISVLEKGNKMTDLKSAEINYALGLLYFDQRNYAAARECATRAYDLGYPLPGLKHKLQKAGQ